MTLLLYLLACISIHRLWNFEAVFEPSRRFLRAYLPPFEIFRKPLLCHACNAFWIPVVLLPLLVLADAGLAPAWYALALLAAYTPIRLALWFQEQAAHLAGMARAGVLLLGQSVRVPTPEECPDCAAKKQALVDRAARLRKYKRRVVVMAQDGRSPVLALGNDAARDPLVYVEGWTPQMGGALLLGGALGASIATLPSNTASADHIAFDLIRQLMPFGTAEIIADAKLGYPEDVWRRLGAVPGFTVRVAP